MPIFTIENAETHVGRERCAGRSDETRTLEVAGRARDGKRNRARFIFGGAGRSPAVGYLTQAGATGVSLVGWLPATAFETFRNAAAEGGPLQVHYETRDRTSGYLRRLGLGRAGAALAAAGAARPFRVGAARQRAPHRGFAMPL